MKKKFVMKVCSLALTAAMIGSVAGCGNDSNSSTSSGSSEDSQSSSATSDTASDDQSESGDAESSEEAAAPEGGEEAYDCGGALIRVGGAFWSDLNDENSENASYIKALDVLTQLEEKYNADIEYVKLDGDDGYNTSDMIQATILSGECYADILGAGSGIMLSLRNYLSEITDNTDFLEIGSTYLEPATWDGHTYGFTTEDIGNTYVLFYSRDRFKELGMEVTPTQKFLAGEWSYDDCIEYLSELKSKLPDGEYPIAMHTNKWIDMAPAANGIVSVDQNGTIHLADEAYVEALEFYRNLIDLGLAAPITEVQKNEDGSISANQSGKGAIGFSENWYLPNLESDVGLWGIAPWPWGSNVTCEGDYTTLSDNYHTSQALWSNMLVPKADYRSEGAKNIPDEVLFKIALDWCDMLNPVGADVRHEAYEVEKSGGTYANLGYEAGTMRSFSTKEDADLYDWMHSRVILDWGPTLNDYVRVYRNGVYVIGAGDDARSTGESFKQQGEAAMADAFK